MRVRRQTRLPVFGPLGPPPRKPRKRAVMGDLQVPGAPPQGRSSTHTLARLMNLMSLPLGTLEYLDGSYRPTTITRLLASNQFAPAFEPTTALLASSQCADGSLAMRSAQAACNGPIFPPLAALYGVWTEADAQL